MMTRYHCDGCGWEGDTPALAEDPLGDLLWTLRVCPECGEEVYQTVILDPEPPQ
jgi:rubredoxin